MIRHWRFAFSDGSIRTRMRPIGLHVNIVPQSVLERRTAGFHAREGGRHPHPERRLLQQNLGVRFSSSPFSWRLSASLTGLDPTRIVFSVLCEISSWICPFFLCRPDTFFANDKNRYAQNDLKQIRRQRIKFLNFGWLTIGPVWNQFSTRRHGAEHADAAARWREHRVRTAIHHHFGVHDGFALLSFGPSKLYRRNRKL